MGHQLLLLERPDEAVRDKVFRAARFHAEGVDLAVLREVLEGRLPAPALLMEGRDPGPVTRAAHVLDAAGAVVATVLEQEDLTARVDRLRRSVSELFVPEKRAAAGRAVHEGPSRLASLFEVSRTARGALAGVAVAVLLPPMLWLMAKLGGLVGPQEAPGTAREAGRMVDPQAVDRLLSAASHPDTVLPAVAALVAIGPGIGLAVGLLKLGTRASVGLGAGFGVLGLAAIAVLWLSGPPAPKLPDPAPPAQEAGASGSGSSQAPAPGSGSVPELSAGGNAPTEGPFATFLPVRTDPCAGRAPFAGLVCKLTQGQGALPAEQAGAASPDALAEASLPGEDPGQGGAPPAPAGQGGATGAAALSSNAESPAPASSAGPDPDALGAEGRGADAPVAELADPQAPGDEPGEAGAAAANEADPPPTRPALSAVQLRRIVTSAILGLGLGACCWTLLGLRRRQLPPGRPA